MLATDELAADKTLALFGRAAARDFVDVFHLLAIYPRHELLRLAARKDPGCTPARFGEAIARLDDRQRADLAVDDDRYTALRAEYIDWLREASPPDRCHHD